MDISGLLMVPMGEDSERAKQYSKHKIRLTFVRMLLSGVFLIVVLLSGTSIFLRDLVQYWTSNFCLQLAAYLTSLYAIYYLLFLPLDLYDSFLSEHKFLLSNQTLSGWLRKSLKKSFLSLAILLLMAEILYLSLRYLPNHWWLVVTMAWVFLTIVFTKITPLLIIPLFYKCDPLDNIDLKTRLIALSKTCGLSARDVFKIQLSKDTKKANAAVAGFGKAQRILLGDTLLNNCSDDEIEAIFAHELGHVRKFHIWKILGFGAMISLAWFYLTHLLIKKCIGVFGLDAIYDFAAFPLLSLVLMIIGLALAPIQNRFMRYLERQADLFVLGHIQNKRSLISALKKLGEQNLSDPSPSRIVELFLYTHPPLSKRLSYISEKI